MCVFRTILLSDQMIENSKKINLKKIKKIDNHT